MISGGERGCWRGSGVAYFWLPPTGKIYAGRKAMHASEDIAAARFGTALEPLARRPRLQLSVVSASVALT